MVKCCECEKEIPKEKSKKHPYNDKYDYCLKCFNFWFSPMAKGRIFYKD